MSVLEVYKFDNEDLSLNTEGYVGLFTARGEMHRSSHFTSEPFVLAWKVPHDEPWTGVNAKELKQELIKPVADGYPSLLSCVLKEVKEWALRSYEHRGEEYFSREMKMPYDYRYSVSAKLANTALYLEISYI